MRHLLENWLAHHRNQANFYLHMVGIPACFLVAPVLLIVKAWAWAAGSFLLGYALQFIGHAIEGTTPGEWRLLKRILRRR